MLEPELVFRPMLNTWEVRWEDHGEHFVKSFPNTLYVRKEAEDYIKGLKEAMKECA